MIGPLKYVTLVLAMLCVVLTLSTCEYRRQYKSTALALSVQNDAIDAQKKEAQRKLDALTKERDDIQTQFNTAKADQEKKDEDFNKALAAMRTAVAGTPVRVRVASCDAGTGGGGSASGVRPGAAGSSAAQGSATGLLPAENSRRLNLALIEVEELSRDFNTCQSRLLAQAKK